MHLLQKESKVIENKGFVYFTKMNGNLEKLNVKFDDKIDHLFKAFRDMHSNIQSLNMDADHLKQDYKNLRVLFYELCCLFIDRLRPNCLIIYLEN